MAILIAPFYDLALFSIKSDIGHNWGRVHNCIANNYTVPEDYATKMCSLRVYTSERVRASRGILILVMILAVASVVC